MQKIPCDVRAYRRFSIFRLQFLHLKQFAQKAWSPVKMAKSSILFPQWLQLYVQLLQMRDPSPRSSRLASESRSVPQVLHRKQSICHLLPAMHGQYMPVKKWYVRAEGTRVNGGQAYQARKLFLPPRSIDCISNSSKTRDNSHLLHRTPCTDIRHHPDRHPGRAATPDSRRASPWRAGAVCVNAVVGRTGVGASELAGRGCGRLAVSSLGRVNGLSCVRDGEQVR